MLCSPAGPSPLGPRGLAKSPPHLPVSGDCTGSRLLQGSRTLASAPHLSRVSICTCARRGSPSLKSTQGPGGAARLRGCGEGGQGGGEGTALGGIPPSRCPSPTPLTRPGRCSPPWCRPRPHPVLPPAQGWAGAHKLLKQKGHQRGGEDDCQPCSDPTPTPPTGAPRPQPIFTLGGVQGRRMEEGSGCGWVLAEPLC